MKKISMKVLKKKKACKDAIRYFEKIASLQEYSLEEVIDHLLEKEKYNWAGWLISRMLNKKKNVMFAVFSARLALHLFEKEYPDDDRPRKAIEAAERYVKRQTKKNPNHKGIQRRILSTDCTDLRRL